MSNTDVSPVYGKCPYCGGSLTASHDCPQKQIRKRVCSNCGDKCCNGIDCYYKDEEYEGANE